jgi:hypothetical protein
MEVMKLENIEEPDALFDYGAVAFHPPPQDTGRLEDKATRISVGPVATKPKN